MVYFSGVDQANKERLYCQDSQDSLERLVSSTVVRVIWRKTVEANSFSLSWFGNCGGGYIGESGELENSAGEDQRCDWTLDVDTFNNIEYFITEITTEGDCDTNHLSIRYFSAVSQVYKERKYCSDPDLSEPALARIVSSSRVTVIWRKTVPTNSFRLSWNGAN